MGAARRTPAPRDPSAGRAISPRRLVFQLQPWSRAGQPSTLRRVAGFHGTVAPRVRPCEAPRPSVYAENRGAEAVWGSALDTATHACPPRPPQQACLTGLCRRRFTVHCAPGLRGPGTLSVGDSDALPENLAFSRFSVLWGHRCKRLILSVTFRREECFARNIKNHH